MKVIPNYNGFCAGVQFTKGVEIDLDQSILKAIGEDAYTIVAQPKKAEKVEKAIENASDKQVLGAESK